MISILAVAGGGALGAVLRYGLSHLVAFPVGTMLINVLGSFLIGIAFILVQDSTMRLLLITGFLGGFTTFSNFSLETLMLWQQGQTFYALSYVVLSVVLSLLAVFAGYSLGKIL